MTVARAIYNFLRNYVISHICPPTAGLLPWLKNRFIAENNFVFRPILLAFYLAQRTIYLLIIKPILLSKVGSISNVPKAEYLQQRHITQAGRAS